MGCSASTSTATSTSSTRVAGASPNNAAGSTAGAGDDNGRPVAVSQIQQPSVVAQPQATPPAQPPGQPQEQMQQRQATSSGRPLQDAKVVKSPVSLSRSIDCMLLTNSDGCFLRISFSASSSGNASLFLLPKGKDELDVGGIPITTHSFQEGFNQTCEIRICEDYTATFDGRSEDTCHLVLELAAAGVGGSKVTSQLTYLKLSNDSSPAQVFKQTVKCGNRTLKLEPLFGTMPNPQAEPQLGDEAGDCVICLSQPKEVAILHCRHVCLCRSCATITSSTWSFQCPVCRGRVAGMVAASKG